MSSLGDQMITDSNVDQALTATSTENPPPGERAFLNREIAEAAEGDMNLWHFLQQNFDLEYSNPDDKLVEKFETRFLNQPTYFEQISRRAYWYLPYIVEEIEKHGLPYDLAIIPIVESELMPTAVSTSKAAGLWQFIPSTGAKFDLRQDWWIDERRDFIKSTRAALDYLTFLLKEFDNDWELALASYNAGSGRVRNAINANMRAKRPTAYSDLKLPRETRSYLPKIVAIRNIISNPEKYGINLHPIPKTATISVIDAKSQTDLTFLASLLSLKPGLLKKLNPGYLQGVTPPTGPHQIVVPTELAVTLVDTLAKKPLWDKLTWDIHRVQKGEYLGAIAAQYNTRIRILKHMNNLESDTIYPDQILRVPATGVDKKEFVAALKEAEAAKKKGLTNTKVQSKDAQLPGNPRKAEESFRVIDGFYHVSKNEDLERITNIFGIPLQQLREMNDMNYSSEVDTSKD